MSLQPVVGAAIIRAGRVLTARRTEPEHLRGRWEFPGGKVEPGEEFDDALVREIDEELGVHVRIVEWLPITVPIAGLYEMRTAITRLLVGEPHPHEHDEIRWLGPDELDTVDWVEADQPFLPYVREVLTQPLVRGIVFDRDAAETVQQRLRTDGWAADLVRERYQGEDDDEDHPWAVVTDAPEFTLEMLIEEYDGWLEVPDRPAPAPLVLPTAPKRIKRPQ